MPRGEPREWTGRIPLWDDRIPWEQWAQDEAVELQRQNLEGAAAYQGAVVVGMAVVRIGHVVLLQARGYERPRRVDAHD